MENLFVIFRKIWFTFCFTLWVFFSPCTSGIRSNIPRACTLLLVWEQWKNQQFSQSHPWDCFSIQSNFVYRMLLGLIIDVLVFNLIWGCCFKFIVFVFNFVVILICKFVKVFNLIFCLWKGYFVCNFVTFFVWFCKFCCYDNILLWFRFLFVWFAIVFVYFNFLWCFCCKKKCLFLFLFLMFMKKKFYYYVSFVYLIVIWFFRKFCLKLAWLLLPF